jgi:hypothetical protein
MRERVPSWCPGGPGGASGLRGRVLLFPQPRLSVLLTPGAGRRGDGGGTRNASATLLAAIELIGAKGVLAPDGMSGQG